MQNIVIGVVAPKGSGKTTRVADLVSTQARVAIYDPMAATDFQYRKVASHIVSHDLREAHLILAEEEFQMLYEPETPVQDGEEWYYGDFRPFLAKCWNRVQKIGPMMLIVDEAHYTMSSRTMPLEMWNIITNGRRYGLDVVWITQRFVGVNGWVRANADAYWFFRLAHVADLATVRDICGGEVMERVRNLRRLDQNKVPPLAGEMLIWSSLDGSVTVEDLASKKRTEGAIVETETSKTDGSPVAECPSDSEESSQDSKDSASAVSDEKQ